MKYREGSGLDPVVLHCESGGDLGAATGQRGSGRDSSIAAAVR